MDILSEAMDKLETLDMSESVDNAYNELLQKEREEEQRIIRFIG